MTFGHPVSVSDLFGVSGRGLLERLAIPEPWATSLATSLRFVDELTAEIDAAERELQTLGTKHPAIPLLMTVPGVGWILAYTIASEIGDIARFASPKKLAGYTGLCPLVRQSGNRDLRGPLAKNGPKYLRWALIEAATHAARDPLYRERYERTKHRLGRTARCQGGARRPRPRAGRSHLARPHQEPSIRPGRPHEAPGRVTTLVWNWAAGAASHLTLSFRVEKAIER